MAVHTRYFYFFLPGWKNGYFVLFSGCKTVGERGGG